jgi:hypothetical protein
MNIALKNIDENYLWPTARVRRNHKYLCDPGKALTDTRNFERYAQEVVRSCSPITPTLWRKDNSPPNQPEIPNSTATTAEATIAHHLTDVLMIAILAVTAGAKGWENIENYGDRRLPWLEQFLELPGGILCADTFRRVFERIDRWLSSKCAYPARCYFQPTTARLSGRRPNILR